MILLRGGRDYPRSVGEFLAWFATDADCRDYLAWLRWPDGFVCDKCGQVGGWQVADGRWKCARCSHRTSVTAGTIFDRTRTPLTVWFQAVWSFATAKDGISALGLQRTLQIGSYQTAWAMLHRLRVVLVRPGQELLSGQVEVDETYIGGDEPGLSGGRAKGKKALVAVAVEVKSPKGFGRCRMKVIPDATAATLHQFVEGNITPGATVITDGWSGYLGLDKAGYIHDRRSQRAAKARGEDPGKLLPGVHRVASLAKRWLSSTHQGAVTPSTWPTCSTSSASGSTAAPPAAAAWCSSAYSSWPSATTGALPPADQAAPAAPGTTATARRHGTPAQHRPSPR